MCNGFVDLLCRRSQCSGKHRQTYSHMHHLDKQKHPPVHALTLISQYTQCANQGPIVSTHWCKLQANKNRFSLLSLNRRLCCYQSRRCVAADARCQLTHKRKRTHYHHYFETYLEVPSSTCQSTLQLQTAPNTSHLADISDWLICLGAGCSKAQRANPDWMSCLKLRLPQPAHNGCRSFIFWVRPVKFGVPIKKVSNIFELY